MSHLIAANNLKAWYDHPHLDVLHVRAEGELPANIFDKRFVRLPSAGGFHLALEGRTAVGPAVILPYVHVQKFHVRIPNIVIPSKSIIVKTTNHPNGVAVPIEYTNGPPPSDDGVASKESDSSTPQVLVDGNEEDRYVFLYGQFSLSANSNVGQTGKVKLDYELTKLQLLNSEIINGNIVYTFRALQLGKTPITVLEAHQNPPYVYEIIYNVDVIPNWGIGPAKAPGSGSSIIAATSTDGKKGGSVSSPYFDLIDIGVSWVKKEYPEAELYQVESMPVYTVPVHNPSELGNLTLTFRAKNKEGEEGSVVTSSIGPAQFTPPVFTVVSAQILGLDPIPWPLKDGALDIYAADAELKKAGWDQGYFKVGLDTPVIRKEQPIYFFKLWAPLEGDVTTVGVGAYDGKVDPLPITTQKH